jgi:hypothetical protein
MGLRHDLVKASRPGCQIRGYPPKIVKAVMDAFRQTDSGTWLLVPQGLMEKAEEAPAAGDCDRHGPQLAQNLLPFQDSDALLSPGYGRQDLSEAFDAVLGQFDRHL